MVDRSTLAGYYATGAGLGLAAVVWSTFGGKTAGVALAVMIVFTITLAYIFEWSLQEGKNGKRRK
jgi:hypothetical protein